MTRGSQGNLANLWAVAGAQSPPSGAEDTQHYFEFCPSCGWQLTAKFSTCPRCKADLRLTPCPYCRGMVPVSADPCPRCSAPTK